VPTHEESLEFWRLYADLTPTLKKAFKRAVMRFAEDLERGQGFRPGLRVKGIRAWPGLRDDVGS
jgi:hypothetical protein